MSDTISRPQCQSAGIDHFADESRSFGVWLWQRHAIKYEIHKLLNNYLRSKI